jgi:hypothetical protein
MEVSMRVRRYQRSRWSRRVVSCERSEDPQCELGRAAALYELNKAVEVVLAVVGNAPCEPLRKA